MEDRSDALVTASRLISAVRDTAVGCQLGVATVGVIESDTHAQSTIPGGVEFVIDVRCSTDELVADLEREIFEAFDRIILQERNRTSYEILRTWGLPESKFHDDCIEAVERAAIDEVGEGQILHMKSRAGHDCAWTSRVCPSSMIFVQSRGGISHHPEEFTSPEQCTLGAQVLLQAVLNYDARPR
jgi:acetylornithine deacetylase/succinyl-diaminopimelate desuccinylase-like protein